MGGPTALETCGNQVVYRYLLSTIAIRLQKLYRRSTRTIRSNLVACLNEQLRSRILTVLLKADLSLNGTRPELLETPLQTCTRDELMICSRARTSQRGCSSSTTSKALHRIAGKL